MLRNIRMAIALGLVTAVTAPPCAAQSHVTTGGALFDDLVARNRAYIEAARTGDVTAMQAMVTDDFVAVTPYYAYMLTGPGAVAADQKAWAAYFAPGNGDAVEYRRESNPIVKDLGEVAILAYVELEAVRTRGDRVRGGRAGKCSFVYRKTPAGWKLANSIITAQPWPDRMITGDRK